MTDIDEDERQWLLAPMKKKGLPNLIIETHIIISNDLTHDNAAVQHFNDQYIEPLLKRTSKDLKMHLVTSDGCCCQFKCANHFFWLSKQQCMHAIRMGWTIGCTAYNKDLSDAECGCGMTEIDRANLAHVTCNRERHYHITSLPMIVEHLRNH